MSYSKTTWVDDSSPFIEADNLNNMEQGIYDAVVLSESNETRITKNEVDISALSAGENPRGEFTPSGGAEYPTGAAVNDSWYIGSLSAAGYTFTAGDLNGQTAYNLDKIIYTSTGWSLISSGLGINTKQNLTSDITVTVGVAGDFSTINLAIEYLTKTYSPTYVKDGFTAEISLLTGFVMAEQVLISQLDLGWITITGVDAETVITRSALVSTFGTTARYPAFCAYNNATLPIINQLFNMDSTGTALGRAGIIIDTNSSGVVSPLAGVKTTPAEGLYVTRQSRAIAYNTNFTACIATAIYATTNSEVLADFATINGSFGSYSLYADSSTISFVGGVSINSGTVNCVLSNSSGKINARDSNCTTNGAGAEYRVLDGSFIDISSATGDTATTQAVNTLTGDGVIFQ